jgi:KipI family sensor histidine kinase inhibitor
MPKSIDIDRAKPPYFIRSQGDRCINVDFGDSINPETGRTCLSASALFRAANLPGVFEIVPTYISVALHYVPTAENMSNGCAYETLCELIHELLKNGIPKLEQASKTVNIPICYGGTHGPDLLDIAKRIGLSPEEVISRHSQSPAMVYMLGFAPGCPYIALLDPVFAIPRRDTPVTAVPGGAVVVANRQNMIYPSTLPCGWHILGSTPLKMFDLDRISPVLLSPGDHVQYQPISSEEYDHIKHTQSLEVHA